MKCMTGLFILDYLLSWCMDWWVACAKVSQTLNQIMYVKHLV
jgi:hypothetical protein